MAPSGYTTQASPEGSKWEENPPYKIQSPEEFGTVHWQGGCHCGQVRYQLNRKKPLEAKFCHCRDCQKLHGAPFQWAAIFHKSDISFKSGHEGLDFFKSSGDLREHNLPCKILCSHCHSPIMDEGRNMILLFPESIDYGDGERKQEFLKLFAPDCHIFYSHRVVDLDDGKPKWESLNDKSKRMDL